MRENADQNNSKYGHFLRSVTLLVCKIYWFAIVYNGLTTSDKFLIHFGPILFFYRYKTSENYTVLKRFQGTKNEALLQYGLRLIYLSNISQWLIRSSEIMVLANPDAVN